MFLRICLALLLLGSICTFALGPQDYNGLDDRDIGLSPDQDHEKGRTPCLRAWHTNCHREGCEGCVELCSSSPKSPVSSLKRLGSLLISAANNGTVRCWDVFSGCCLRLQIMQRCVEPHKLFLALRCKQQTAETMLLGCMVARINL